MKNSKKLTKEVTELVKPIVEHEAKSAFYKGKLITVLTGKTLYFIGRKVKNICKFTSAYISELKRK